MENVEEKNYLALIHRVLETGILRTDRTGTGTLSVFGAQLRFSLRNNVFPLLTTKKVFWRGIAEELMWFIKGDTNSNNLKKKGVHIWDAHGSKENLKKLGFKRDEGDLGPVYGFQWRFFGAEYKDHTENYSGQGIDQLKNCIDLIKHDPSSRRIILTARNPQDIGEMVLPPCHCFCQFYVANGELSCQMYQRSADIGLGVPFNIASYSLLTIMVAQVCGLTPGEFIHTIGDAHIYTNHITALRQQITREPTEFPILKITREITDIDDFTIKDFEILNYNPQDTIKMEMAV